MHSTPNRSLKLDWMEQLGMWSVKERFIDGSSINLECCTSELVISCHEKNMPSVCQCRNGKSTRVVDILLVLLKHPPDALVDAVRVRRRLLVAAASGPSNVAMPRHCVVLYNRLAMLGGGTLLPKRNFRGLSIFNFTRSSQSTLPARSAAHASLGLEL